MDRFQSNDTKTPMFAIFSFVKTDGSVPDKDGVFGFAKIQGVFYTEVEAVRAKEAMNSPNSVDTVVCGRPFPVMGTRDPDMLEIDPYSSFNYQYLDNAYSKGVREFPHRPTTPPRMDKDTFPRFSDT